MNEKQNDPARQQPSATEIMMQMMSGLRVSRGIYIAAKLGIADFLKTGAKTADELAALTGAHADSLYRVLRMLAMGNYRELSGSWFPSVLYLKL